MTISFIIESFILILTFSLFYTGIASISLAIYSQKYGASLEDVEVFIEKLPSKLPSPLNYIYSPSHLNPFTILLRTSIEETISKKKTVSRIPRYILTALAVVVITLWANRLSRQSETLIIIRDGIFILFNISALFASWRFGRKLKDIVDT